ncbi:helix-turn-helix domain-containing protein [Paraconexibacter algicola]|uniref:PucR family transcriptional regulator n=1 Tax=Paraconexibacter algicola TaxID=2133960 RepID=A0A2T4UIN5_9ACTN|nr:helix-turn-helix domain-containing protein [Paraconexibacter algicola]PTL59092.1 PucR family transcriptional regulator [Paraconexibacter algicola]
MQHQGVTPWQDIPPSLAPGLQERIPRITEDIIRAVRAEVREYDQPLEGEFGRLISQGVRQALEQFVGLLGTAQTAPDAGIYAAMGRAELDAGRTLDALQSAYRTGARVAWRGLVSEADGLDPGVMFRLAEAIFAYIDQLAAASVAGYSEALASRAGSVQTRRQALVDELLAEQPSATAVRAAARAAQWTVPETLAVVVADHADPVALVRRAPSGTLPARTPDGAVLIVPDPDGPGRRERLAACLAGVASVIGPTVAPGEAHRAARRAAVALGRLQPGGPVRADEHRLDLLLAADPPLVAEIVQARLGPIAGLSPAARARARRTLRAWLDTHGDVTRMAEQLHVHPQTVRYRMAGLRELLGPEAFDEPAARFELQVAVRASS